MLKERTWREFREAGLLWWVNRLLSLLGWCIVLEIDSYDNVINAYPARTKYRGFSDEAEKESFSKWSAYMLENSHQLFCTDLAEDEEK